MQVNLDRTAPPTFTQRRRFSLLGQGAAAYALSFTVTISSTVAHEDYNARMTIAPASLSTSADRTNVILQEDKVGSGTSWLAKAIAEMHATISDESWDDVPDTSKVDIDAML